MEKDKTNSCEYGEDKALDTYDDALKNDFDYLSIEQQTMISAQKSLIKADHEHVKTLRDALADA